MRKPVSVSLEVKTLIEIDKLRGAISRSRFVEDLISKAIYGDEKDKAEVAGYV